MLVAWSPIRSMFFEQNSRWAQNGDVARIFHHVGEEIAKHRVLERVELGVALPHRARALGVALGIGVEHVLQQLGRDVVHVAGGRRSRAAPRFDADLQRALGDVLGEVADPLEVAGDADRADDLAQIDRHRLAPGDGEDRLLLDLALQRVEARVGGDDLMGERGVGLASASIASITIFSAMPPISAIRRSRASSSLS